MSSGGRVVKTAEIVCDLLNASQRRHCKFARNRCDLPCHTPFVDSVAGRGRDTKPVVRAGEADVMGPIDGRQSKLRLAPASRTLRGPDKYKVLEHRRRQAQIKARRLLELTDEAQ